MDKARAREVGDRGLSEKSTRLLNGFSDPYLLDRPTRLSSFSIERIRSRRTHKDLEKIMAQQYRVVGLSTVTPLVVLLISCSGAAPKAGKDALDSLRRVQAAVQVGVNYQQYGELLMDAKAKTNAASRALPDGPIKTELNSVIDAYLDASRVWQFKIDNRLLDRNSEPDRSLIAKYSLPVKEYNNVARPDEALQVIWRFADMHINEAGKLLD